MLFYLGQALRQHIGVFNVLAYITVRAGGAVVTAFLICLIVGPAIIRALRALKLGQHIRQEHVKDLHALHNHKSGTPTMGGVLIVTSTLAALALWADFRNRLLICAVAVFAALCLVGFIDDFISLKRKKNLGLGVKAKFACQAAIGVVLGVYLYLCPITTGRALLTRDDIIEWARLPVAASVEKLRSIFPESVGRLEEQEPRVNGRKRAPGEVLDDLNRLIMDADLASDAKLEEIALSKQTQGVLRRHATRRDDTSRRDLNRLLLSDALPGMVAKTPPDLHARIEIPGLKNVLIPLGVLYVVFIALVIVGASNAVNLTDGLDGLAIGAATVSLLAYTAIAYIVSRADWTRYLYVIYVPEASELAVFGAALMGAGLGFLWFNSHPAEVFMGDTGSLALGGAIGAMAILTKQELLLLVVGGLFVLEAASVIIQVTAFKLTRKRIFRMAPLHHHFELKGWSETKVTVRFWILAILFALMSLGALKLR